MYISQIIEQLTEDGVYQIESGVHLFTQECIINEQEDWDDEDPCKKMDFTGSPLWLVAGHETPIPYASFSEYISEFWG